MQSFVGRHRRCRRLCPLHLAMEVKILQNICMRNFSHNSKGGSSSCPSPVSPFWFVALAATLAFLFGLLFQLLFQLLLLLLALAAPAAPASLSSSSERAPQAPLGCLLILRHYTSTFFDTYSTSDRVPGGEKVRGRGRGKGSGYSGRHSNGNRTMCANTKFNERAPKKTAKINCKAIVCYTLHIPCKVMYQ